MPTTENLGPCGCCSPGGGWCGGCCQSGTVPDAFDLTVSANLAAGDCTDGSCTQASFGTVTLTRDVAQGCTWTGSYTACSQIDLVLQIIKAGEFCVMQLDLVEGGSVVAGYSATIAEGTNCATITAKQLNANFGSADGQCNWSAVAFFVTAVAA